MKKNHTMRATVALSLAALLGGCATVTGTTNQSVSVQARTPTGSEVHGANCELNNDKGKWFITTPGSAMVQRSAQDLQVLCNKRGTETGRASAVSNVKGAMWGNVLAGGIIGAVIDHNNGAAYDYPNLIHVLMGQGSTTASATPGADPGIVYANPDAPSDNQQKAEALAAQSCTSAPRAYSMASGGSVEIFSIACANGSMMRVRCDAGTCRHEK